MLRCALHDHSLSLMMIPIYEKKTRIKVLVAVLALLIGAATIIYTNWLVQRVSEREQQQIQLYAKAQEYIISAESESSTFVVNEIVNANATIPVILSSNGKDIIAAKNVPMPARLPEADSMALLQRELLLMQQQHPPIVVQFGAGQVNYIFYRDSQLLRQLRTYPLVQLVVIGCLASSPTSRSARRAGPSKTAYGWAWPRKPPTSWARRSAAWWAGRTTCATPTASKMNPLWRNWARTSGGSKSSPSGSATSARCRC